MLVSIDIIPLVLVQTNTNTSFMEKVKKLWHFLLKYKKINDSEFVKHNNIIKSVSRLLTFLVATFWVATKYYWFGCSSSLRLRTSFLLCTLVS